MAVEAGSDLRGYALDVSGGGEQSWMRVLTNAQVATHTYPIKVSNHTNNQVRNHRTLWYHHISHRSHTEQNTKTHMNVPLLKTKLYIPPVSHESVPRPRLIEQIKIGLDRGHRLTLVSAPAGSGKTTLLGDCAAVCGYPAAWLSLDENDNDLSIFWTYLIAALQNVKQGLGQDAIHLLQTPTPPPIHSILTPLLNDLATLADKIVLILDDYHVIATPDIHQGIAFLLDHQPPQLHLVLSTRADPTLPIARLRARRQITELRAHDLRFTDSETTTFVNQVMKLDLHAQDVAALQTRTEGWIVGLQLAALAMKSPQAGPAPSDAMRLSSLSLAVITISWNTWPKRWFIVSPHPYSSSCCIHPSSSDYAARSATPSWAAVKRTRRLTRPLALGTRLTRCSATTSLSFHWITNTIGTATITCLPICSATCCGKKCPPNGSGRCIAAPASGTNGTANQTRRSSTPCRPTIMNEPHH
ncbi:MAG: hypothetical protein JXA89_06500 [Anaerolineae bacterium]|nr:hypothetical protein [Anaerolineae bacterium]